MPDGKCRAIILVRASLKATQSARHFPPPWTVEQIPGRFKVLDSIGQALAYVFGRESRADADTRKDACVT